MNPSAMLGNTIVDGELVIDLDPKTQQVSATRQRTWLYLTIISQQIPRFLAFDCLVVDNESVMAKSLEKRYGVL